MAETAKTTETAAATLEPPKITYRGNCYCKAFVFEATIPEIKEINRCRCSICSKKALILAFCPNKDFKVVSGSLGDLSSYSFGSGIAQHLFCPKCGVAIGCTVESMLPDQIAFSVRALQGPIDVWNLPRKQGVDAKDMGQPYVPPKYTGPEPPRPVEGGRVVHGSCHCGDVTVALRTNSAFSAGGPAADPSAADGNARITECNCSICQRIGACWNYPHRDQVVIRVAEDGEEEKKGEAKEKEGEGLVEQHQLKPPPRLARYRGGMTDKLFCARCGVFVAGPLNIATDDEFAALPPGAREYLADKREEIPINLRIFTDIDVDGLSSFKFDGWNILQPPYENP